MGKEPSLRVGGWIGVGGDGILVAEGVGDERGGSGNLQSEKVGGRSSVGHGNVSRCGISTYNYRRATPQKIVFQTHSLSALSHTP